MGSKLIAQARKAAKNEVVTGVKLRQMRVLLEILIMWTEIVVNMIMVCLREGENKATESRKRKLSAN